MTNNQQTVKRSDGRGIIQDAVRDKKKAVALGTMGMQFAPNGIYVS
jgi:hypothetical protein